MNARSLTIIAGAVAALVGVIFLAPDLFGFLGLPAGFAGLGLERVITGFALLLLGFIGVLSELDPQPKKRRGPSPFAFQAEPATAGPGVPANGYDPFDAPLGAGPSAPQSVPEWDSQPEKAPPAHTVSPDGVIVYPEAFIEGASPEPEPARPEPRHLTVVEPTRVDPEPELPFDDPDKPKPAA